MSQNVPKKEQAGLHRGPRNLAFHVMGHVPFVFVEGGIRFGELGPHGFELVEGHVEPAEVVFSGEGLPVR